LYEFHVADKLDGTKTVPLHLTVATIIG